MTTRTALAAIIRQRYDECPPGKWPMEESLAEFILEHAASVGLAIVPAVAPGGTVPIPLIRTIRIAAHQYCEGTDDPCDVRELHAARVIAEAIVATAEVVRS